MTDLSSLIERVEKLTGADREADAALFDLMGARPCHNDVQHMWVYRDYDYADADEFELGAPQANLPRYTASLDAAVAFTEATLPGWWLELSGDREVGFLASVEGPKAGDPCGGSGQKRKPTLALALILAALKALQAKEIDHG